MGSKNYPIIYIRVYNIFENILFKYDIYSYKKNIVKPTAQTICAKYTNVLIQFLILDI